MKRHLGHAIAAVAIGLALLPFAAPAHAGGPTFVVDTEPEYRDALAAASVATGGPQTVVIDKNIKIEGAVDPTYSGTEDLIIDGQGQFELDGGNNSRVVFSDATDADLTIRGLTVVAGLADGDGGAVRWPNDITVETSVLGKNRALGVDDQRGGAVYAGGTVDIDDSLFSTNSAEATGPEADARGGALYAEGDIDIDDTDLRLNVVTAADTAYGGAAVGGDGVTVTDSTVSENAANGGRIARAGGVYGDPITVTASVFEQNRVVDVESASGGALYSLGDVSFTDSVARGNRAETTTDGPAIDVSGGAIEGQTATVVGSTLADNELDTPGQGRGIAVSAPTAAVRNSTVANNVGEDGNISGGIRVSSGPLTLDHSTVTGSTGDNVEIAFTASLSSFASVLADPGDDNCVIGGSASVSSSGYNYVTDDSCGFTAEETDTEDGPDPLLGPPRDNGDLVAATEAGGDGTARPTQYPLNGSPLIDQIPPGIYSAFPDLTNDQRGLPRPFGEASDIGAIEAAFPAHAFSDATPFFEASVRWVTSEVNTPQILLGFGDGTFGQELNITRGQAARLYHRGAGSPDPSSEAPHGFSDVTPFYEDAVRWAKGVGLFNGYPDNTFRQGDPITRGQYIRSLYNFAGAQEPTSVGPHGLSDVTPFYEDAVRWAKGRGLANGFPDDTFRQNDDIKRGNAARTFYNTAQTPAAWELHGLGGAPPNMLFESNLPT